MSEPFNPYNSTRPGNLFTGYERERKQLRSGLRNGKSYAVLGGRRCGKTSLLLDLETEGLADFTALPRFYDVQERIPRSTGSFFRTVAALTVRDLDVEPWRGGRGSQPYQEFLNYIDTVRSRLEARYGESWLVVLLIDEIDVAGRFLLDAECFQNLRNLLMISRYAGHFRMVASGVASLVELIDTGSPLNNLEPCRLRRLHQEEARSLIVVGFGSSVSSEERLLELTGGHPYLLQGILESLWQIRDEKIDEDAVADAVRQFVRNHSGIFQRWIEMLGSDCCSVYQALVHDGRGLSASELKSAVQGGGSVSNAVDALAYHGLVDDSDFDHPRITGTIFRDWFRANHDLGMDSGAAIAGRDRVEPTPEGRRSHSEKHVFVVFGRNSKIYQNMLKFLRALKLEPLEWLELVEATGKGAPYIGEVLEQGFSMAQAAIVLMTPDDEGRLLPKFHKPDDPRSETETTPQPRPNVIFEAGMAMAKFPEKTILVRFGRMRIFSDISGIFLLDMDGSLKAREHLAQRLEKCGCAVDLEDTYWHTAGDLSLES